MNRQKTGFILPLTVIIVFAISALVIRLMKEISIALPEQAMVQDREQAKQVALMGIYLIQAQLAHKEEDAKDKKAFYERLFAVLNRWSTYTLHKKTEGMDAELLVYVSCENGKIPLNALWDFKNKKYVVKNNVEVKKLLEHVILQKKQGDKSKEHVIVQELENFLKTQKHPLEDVTTLLIDPTFQGLSQPFFTQALPENNKPAPFAPTIGDLFTAASDELSLQPCFLSVSTGEVFGLKQDNLKDEKKREEFIKKLSEQKKGAIDWSKQWDEILAPVYNKKYESLSVSLKQLFNPTIGASLISVVSYGKVGTITQKIRVEFVQESDVQNQVTYKIRKFYWL